MESTLEQNAEGIAIVRVLAEVLDRLVTANAPMARSDPGQVTKFHAMKAPGITVRQYLERIHQYASCSNECFILALIYIDRLIQCNNFLLTDLNVHRVVVTAVLLAAKFFDDAYYNNAYYAKVGGVMVSEINGLEVDFLFRINFSLHVSPEEFEKYWSELLSHAATVAIAAPPPAQVSPEVRSAPVPGGAFADATAAHSDMLLVSPEAFSAAVVAAAAAANFCGVDNSTAANIIPQDNDYTHHQHLLQEQVLAQTSLHRSNSMPPLQAKSQHSPIYIPPHLASAPICPQGIGPIPHFPSSNETLTMVMKNANGILPIQTKLLHHHHHGGGGVGSSRYGQPHYLGNNYVIHASDMVASQPLSQAPRLAAFSGFGL